MVVVGCQGVNRHSGAMVRSHGGPSGRAIRLHESAYRRVQGDVLDVCHASILAIGDHFASDAVVHEVPSAPHYAADPRRHGRPRIESES